MSENNIRFYQIFRFGNTIGVNEMNLGDIIIANFMTLAVMVILMGLFVTLIPFFLLFIYAFTVMLGSWDNINQERIAINLFSIIACIYFLFDYHYGFIGWRVIHTFTSTASVDKFCHMIFALLILNLILIFFGNKIIAELTTPLARLIAFGGICFFTYKVLYPISSLIVPSITTQYYEKEKPNQDEGGSYEEIPYQEDEENDEY